MLPRLRTQRATLTASLLVLTGCVIGGANATAPAADGVDDSDTISVSESPALGSVPEGRGDAAADPPEPNDGGNVDSATAMGQCDGGLCSDVPEGCMSAQFDGHGYLFCDAAVTWSAARTRCQDLALDLVIIQNETENAFVAEHLLATSWIGASDQATEGSFLWVVPGADSSGSAVTFVSWAPTVPDNCGGLFGQQDCVRVSKDGLWDDSDCNGGCLEGTFAFVCESY